MKGEVMSKLRKLVLTTAALAALAVGGAAFAQAQNAGTAATVHVQKAMGETGAPGDTDNVQSGDQSGSDQGDRAGEQGSGAESKTEAPDSASEKDSPDGSNDQPDSPSDHESGNE
jgi:hypothetical protein